MTLMPLAFAWASSFFCPTTISVLPPRSVKGAPASTARRAMSRLK